MARKAEKEKTKDGLKLKIVNPNAAGIDIAYGEMQVWSDYSTLTE